MAEPADDVDRIDSSRLGRDSVAGQVFNRYADRVIQMLAGSRS